VSDAQRAAEADQQARLAAQTSFERPLLLVAGAGTGKTTALVARVVAWCVGPGWQRAEARLAAARLPGGSAAGEEDRIAGDVLSRVVAITFTEAAAAEMAARVGAVFSQLATGGWPVGLMREALEADEALPRGRAQALLGCLDQLRVSTIHSFCRSLLARHPLEAGLHPRFEVDADERVHAEVVHDEVLRALREADEALDSHPLLELAAGGVSMDQVQAALLELLRAGVSPEAFAADPLSPERVEAALGELLDAVARLWACVERPLSVDGLRPSTTGLLEVLSFTRDELDPELCAASGVELEAQLSALHHEWEGGKAAELGAAMDQVAQRAGELLPILDGLLGLDPARIAATRALLAPMLGRALQALRARGVIGFSGLLVGARDLLASQPELRAAWSAGIDQLMVDEFQDTDPVQCEIVRWLALAGPADSRPGLFLVGDPKQSIYGWRSADLRAYDGFAREIEEQGGELRSLCVNFRSAPAILDEVERVIEPVMIREPGVQPEFEPLQACEAHLGDPGFTGEGFAPVEHWVAWQWDAEAAEPAKTSSAEATALEAQALAADLRRLHDHESVAWGDVGVLFRAMSDLDVYLAALRELGVPYAVERDRSYYRRREVIDAAALVRCVLDPNDTLALLTVLRSPAVGVPDAALIPLFAADLPSRVAGLASAAPDGTRPLAELMHDVAEQLVKQSEELPGIGRVSGWESSAAAAIETIGALRESYEHDPPDRFVEKMRSLHLGEVAEAARHLGRFRVANLERFHREVLADLAEGQGGEPLLRRLRSDVSTAREAEEEGPKTSELDAVRVMTIHRAKGLDFQHVYVMQLHKGAGRSGLPREAVSLEGGTLEYRLFGTATPGFARVRARAAEVEAVERVRTLYVATTRAKRRVVLSGKRVDVPLDRLPRQASSPADLLNARRGLVADAWRDAPQPQLESWMAELAAEARADAVAPARVGIDALGVRWRFPGLVQTGDRSAREGVRSAGLPDESELRALSQELLRQRGEAELRMARPWQRAASGLRDDQRSDRAPEEPEEPAQRGVDSSSAVAAAAAGSAVHRLFEDLDLALPLEEGLFAQRGRLPELLRSLCAEAAQSEALARAEQVLDRFEAGPLFAHLDSLRCDVVARELPVWQRPADEDTAAVGVVSGVIDLVHREEATGKLVVVDYKTDRVEGEALEARAAHYAGQAAAYVDALTDALGLDERPRFELWFLHAGRRCALEV
jgi:ATP-dependent helicase/nuclease subunit A